MLFIIIYSTNIFHHHVSMESSNFEVLFNMTLTFCKKFKTFGYLMQRTHWKKP